MLAAPTSVAEKFKALRPVLNELARRRGAATEALAFGRGGISAVARATGLSHQTSRTGRRERRSAEGAAAAPETPRRRRPGAGRRRRAAQDPTLLGALETLVEPTTRGAPQSPWRWTCKSVRRLAADLQAQGHQGSPPLVSALLHGAGDRLHGARKTREGAQHPDRNAQLEHIAARVRDFPPRGEPVSRSRPRRRRWWAISSTPGASGTPKARRPNSGSTMLSIRSWARPLRLASMTCTRTSVGSASAETRTRRPSRWQRSGPGGSRWARPCLRRPRNCCAPPTAAAATAPARGCGRGHGSASPLRAVCASVSARCPQAPARGTPSRSAGSATSRPTGVASRWRAGRVSSASWARPPRRRAGVSRRRWTLACTPRGSKSVMPR